MKEPTARRLLVFTSTGDFDRTAASFCMLLAGIGAFNRLMIIKCSPQDQHNHQPAHKQQPKDS